MANTTVKQITIGLRSIRAMLGKAQAHADASFANAACVEEVLEQEGLEEGAQCGTR
jgi:hypothetical protein